jgi:hypothetical protein
MSRFDGGFSLENKEALGILKGCKSEDEIERLTVDETKDLVQRCLEFLTEGIQVQKLRALDDIPNLLQSHYADTIQKVLPFLPSYLHASEVSLQRHAGKMFEKVSSLPMIEEGHISSVILPIILRMLNVQVEDVSTSLQTWIAPLRKLFPRLSSQTLTEEIVPFALRKGDISASLSSRFVCAEIIGDLSVIVPNAEDKTRLSEIATRMCQDTSSLVREAMCRAMVALANGLGPDWTSSSLVNTTYFLISLILDPHFLISSGARAGGAPARRRKARRFVGRRRPHRFVWPIQRAASSLCRLPPGLTASAFAPPIPRAIGSELARPAGAP